MAVSTAYSGYTLPRTFPPTFRSVWAKRNWADAWEYIPYLDWLTAVDVAAPSIGEARLKYDYGWIKREDTTGFAGYYPLRDLSGSYVQLRSSGVNYARAQAPLWHGVVDFEQHTPHGTTDWMQGPQEFRAYSLNHLLDRMEIDGAYTENGWIARDVRFNGRDGRGLIRRGNRTSLPNADGVYLFGADGHEWSNLDIIKHLIYHYTPTGLTIKIVGEIEPLSFVFEEYDFTGRTLFKALCDLIDEKRGLGWTLRSNGTGTIYLEVFSVLTEPVSVGKYTVPANKNQAVLNFDGRIDGQPRIVFNRLATYDQVVVKGGPIFVTFSASKADGTLQNAWTNTQETDYLAAADDSERATEKFKPVFQEFRVPSDWDWTAGDGEGGTKYPIALAVDDQGIIQRDAADVAWNEGHVFERETCIKSDSWSEANPEHKAVFVVVKDPTEEKWHFVHKLNTIELKSASVRVMDTEMAIRVEPPLNHVAAMNHDEGIGDTDVESEYDYDTYIATVQVQTDSHLLVNATLPGVPLTETGRTKIIRYPGAVAWVVAPGTVLDIEDGALVKAADYVVERDDSDTLRAIAALAAAWYLQPRSDLQFVASNISQSHPVGQMVRGVSSVWAYANVGSVITKREWDCTGTVPSTRWQTGFCELSAPTIAGDITGMKGLEKGVKGRRAK